MSAKGKRTRGGKRKDDDEYQPGEFSLTPAATPPPTRRRASSRAVALTPKMKDRDMDAIQDKKLMQHLANLEKDNFGFTEEDAAQATAEEDAEGPFSKKKKRRKSGLRRLRKYNFDRVLEEEAEQDKDAEVNYFSVQAEPSRLPPRHFCSVCGYFANYTCTKCRSRFCCVRCKATHEEHRCQKFKV